MPELDRFERAFDAGWRRAYRRARMEAASLEEVADILAGTLAKVMREAGGVPGLREMERVVEETVQGISVGFDSAGQEAEALIRAFTALESIVQDHAGHAHTKIASDVAKSMIVHIGEGAYCAALCRAHMQCHIGASLLCQCAPKLGCPRQTRKLRGSPAVAEPGRANHATRHNSYRGANRSEPRR